jgi:hypothetical protein
MIGFIGHVTTHPWYAMSLSCASEGALLATISGGTPEISALCFMLNSDGP